MRFHLVKTKSNDFEIALELLKSAAEYLAKKNINQWSYWLNPPQEKIIWLKEGFKRNEFYLIKTPKNKLIGMVRIMYKDLIYWGEMNDKAIYVHSLVIRQEFKGHKIGQRVIDIIKVKAVKKNIELMRLDCDNSNKKLCNYYENIGFQKVGEKKLKLGQYNLYQKYL